eukprot:1593047-Amphidinium_carterae.1
MKLHTELSVFARAWSCPVTLQESEVGGYSQFPLSHSIQAQITAAFRSGSVVDSCQVTPILWLASWGCFHTP